VHISEPPLLQIIELAYRYFGYLVAPHMAQASL
jgi:hypothetical protein